MDRIQKVLILAIIVVAVMVVAVTIVPMIQENEKEVFEGVGFGVAIGDNRSIGSEISEPDGERRNWLPESFTVRTKRLLVNKTYDSKYAGASNAQHIILSNGDDQRLEFTISSAGQESNFNLSVGTKDIFYDSVSKREYEIQLTSISDDSFRVTPHGKIDNRDNEWKVYANFWIFYFG